MWLEFKYGISGNPGSEFLHIFINKKLNAIEILLKDIYKGTPNFYVSVQLAKFGSIIY